MNLDVSYPMFENVMIMRPLAGTPASIVEEFRLAFPDHQVGFRNRTGKIVRVPRTLWERIKRVFTGPVFVSLEGNYQVALLGPVPTEEDKQQAKNLANDVRVIGTVLEVKFFDDHRPRGKEV